MMCAVILACGSKVLLFLLWHILALWAKICHTEIKIRADRKSFYTKGWGTSGVEPHPPASAGTPSIELHAPRITTCLRPTPRTSLLARALRCAGGLALSWRAGKRNVVQRQ